jgi:hypothetical protein
MTEAEWLTCTDPMPMLEFLGDKASARKFRLFAVACCRVVWHPLIDERSRVAVEAAERFSDGLLAEGERKEIFSSACNTSTAVRRSPDAWTETVLRLRRQHPPDKLWRASIMAAFTVGKGAGEAEGLIRWAEGNPVDGVTQSRLLCDIFGNFFRPITLNPLHWLTPKVVALAQTIYVDRVFDRLPILAVGLEEAGCTDQAILDHCRGPGPHIRGCWVVDLILGKN